MSGRCFRSGSSLLAFGAWFWTSVGVDAATSGQESMQLRSWREPTGEIQRQWSASSVKPDRVDVPPPPFLPGNEQEGVRWVDSSVSWIPLSVSLGDRAASLARVGAYQTDHAAVYSAGSDDWIFARPSGDGAWLDVAAADRAPLVAHLWDVADDAGDRRAHIEMLSSSGSGDPLWSYDFPFRNPDLSPTPSVHIARDGSRVVGIAGRYRRSGASSVRITTLDGDGAVVSTARVDDTAFHGRSVLSHDGEHLALEIGGRAHVLDTATGTFEYIASEFATGGLAISGDGRRVAWGGNDRVGGVSFAFVSVWEDRGGRWEQLRRWTFGSNTDAEGVALDADGDTLLVAVQSLELTGFDLVALDVDQDDQLFRHTVVNPRSEDQVLCSGVDLDDGGETFAAISWGDTHHATPHALFLDRSGEELYSFLARGSALSVDLSADGRHFAVGSTVGHVNRGSRHGDVFYGSTRPEALRVHGQPIAGESLRLEVTADPATFALLIGTARLDLPAGSVDIDPSSLLAVWAPESGFANEEVVVPPGLAGIALHLQGVSVTPAGIEPGNTESVRLLEG